MTNVGRKIAVFTLLLCASPSFAWCLAGRSCATDDSVCDMGRNTTHILSRKTFVWVRANRKVEIYQRLAAAEILNWCRDGQVLMLHSDGSLGLDRSVLPELGKRFCRVADIVSTTIPPLSGEDPGFEIKCTISKMEEAGRFFREREALISTAQMIEEDNKSPVGVSGGSLQDDRASGSSNDCEKWSLGMVFGLPGRCTGR